MTVCTQGPLTYGRRQTKTRMGRVPVARSYPIDVDYNFANNKQKIKKIHNETRRRKNEKKELQENCKFGRVDIPTISLRPVITFIEF